MIFFFIEWKRAIFEWCVELCSPGEGGDGVPVLGAPLSGAMERSQWAGPDWKGGIWTLLELLDVELGLGVFALNCPSLCRRCNPPLRVDADAGYLSKGLN